MLLTMLNIKLSWKGESCSQTCLIKSLVSMLSDSKMPYLKITLFNWVNPLANLIRQSFVNGKPLTSLISYFSYFVLITHQTQ